MYTDEQIVEMFNDKYNTIDPQCKEYFDAYVNADFVTLEAGGVYKYEFTNKFFLRPFYHSFGRVVNRITQGG